MSVCVYNAYTLFCSLFLQFYSLVSQSLNSRRRNVSIKRHNNDSIDLEVKTAIRPQWAPPAFETMGKEGSYIVDRVD
jgi:hypothetical protein